MNNNHNINTAKKAEIIDTEQFRIVLLPKEESNTIDMNNQSKEETHQFSIRVPQSINRLLNQEKMETNSSKKDIINRLLAEHYADRLSAGTAINKDGVVYAVA